jgi:hypothetical protein
MDMNNIADIPVEQNSVTGTVKIQKKVAEASAIKLLPKLIEAFTWNHKDRIAEVGENMAVTIEIHHPAVAKRIRDTFGHELRPKNLMAPTNLLSYEEARHGIESVILPASIEDECHAIVQEHNRQEELRTFGLDPRHRVLLHGEPGNGKTLLAEALAHELQVPFLRIKYGGLLASYMGETGKNIDTILEYAKTAPCVLFLDEFDGVGMDRNGNGNDVGEIRRITNQLLIALERIPSTCVFVAATNSLNLVDKALKRRFDFVIEVPAPTKELIQRCAAKELSPSLTPGRDVSSLADRVAELGLQNLSDVVNLCKRIRRDLVLNDGVGVEMLLELRVV